MRSFILFCAIVLAAAWEPNSLFEESEKIINENQLVRRPPTYSAYELTGYIELPYAEIKEPFTVYYDPDHNKSRIDYYDGLVKTIQRGDSDNAMYKIVYISTEQFLNKQQCFRIEGGGEHVAIQSGIPDLHEFEYIGKTDYHGRTADHWRFVEKIGAKKNVYSFIVDPHTGSPYRYEMAGYDSLFGSHYDKYYIEYTHFSPVPPRPEVFDPPADMECNGWGQFPSGPSTGQAEHKVLMNPLSEFVSGKTEHHDEMFDHFKQQHNKEYPTEKEHAARKSVFLQNVRYIHSTNRAGKSYKVGINHLADRTDAELKVLRGFRRSNTPSEAESFDEALHGDIGFEKMPESIDWRLYGAVTPVKDQAVCGSCWSFGTTGAVEGAHFLKTGNLVRLSQQELVDCSWGEGNNACDGGEDFNAYKFIMKHGLSSEEFYGPYIAQDGLCKVMNATPVAHITGYVSIPSGDQDALRKAMVSNGPISVAIDASHKSLSFYANGVYYEPKCGNQIDQLDHAVLAVGFGTLRDGSEYFLVKNSWSTYWGNDGYVLFSTKDNNCGVATAATFVKM